MIINILILKLKSPKHVKLSYIDLLFSCKMDIWLEILREFFISPVW